MRYPDFHSITRAVTLAYYTSSFEPVFQAVQQLLTQHYQAGTCVRLIGVTVSNLKQTNLIIEQQDLFTDETAREKYNQLNRVMDQINGKYGGDTLHRARKLTGGDKNGELS
jgi:hypothetical protein